MKENDILSKVVLGISREGYLVRSKGVLRDAIKIKKNEFITKMVNHSVETINLRELSIIRYNNKLMGIKPQITQQKRKTSNKIYQIKKETPSILFEGKRYNIINN
jgi:hypothetical protein